jgi:phage tail-like protein
MRGMVEGLESAAPLALRLPAVYQEDEFVQRFMSAFDSTLAPVIATLDDLAAYIDPRLAPGDFVDWLAGWVGMALDDTWPASARRAVVMRAVSLHRRRGTVGGLVDLVALSVGGDVEVEVVESGAARWSREAGSPLPGDATAALHVRLIMDDPARADLPQLNALIASVKPAHITHTVEVAAR